MPQNNKAMMRFPIGAIFWLLYLVLSIIIGVQNYSYSTPVYVQAVLAQLLLFYLISLAIGIVLLTKSRGPVLLALFTSSGILTLQLQMQQLVQQIYYGIAFNFYTVRSILSPLLIASSMLLLASFTVSREPMPMRKSMAQSLWFLPGILDAVSVVLTLTFFLMYSYRSSIIIQQLPLILNTIGIFLIGHWLAYPYKKTMQPQFGSPYGASPNGAPYMGMPQNTTPPYPGQPIPGMQPYPNQPVPGAQPYPNQQTPGAQPYPNQKIPGVQPYPNQQISGALPDMNQPVSGSQPYSSRPLTSTPAQQSRPLAAGDSAGANTAPAPFPEGNAENSKGSSSGSTAPSSQESSDSLSYGTVDGQAKKSRSYLWDEDK